MSVNFNDGEVSIGMIQTMIFFHKSNKKIAINQFIEEHWQTIYRLSVRLTGCPIDGQDLAHDVVVRIISQQKTLTSRNGATAWIAKVTYHLFIDQWRQKKKIFTKKCLTINHLITQKR